MIKIESKLPRFVKFGNIEIKPFDNFVDQEDLAELQKNKIFKYYVKQNDFVVSDAAEDEAEDSELTEESLRTLTVVELKAMCKEKGISGYSKLKEDELIELLLA